MRIRTDDEIYRVDAVWLGPPKATFPWRVRYVAWGVGIAVFLLVLTVQRQLGFGFGFFSTAWGLIITIVITRIICARISHERPLSAVAAMWFRELTTPREQKVGTGGAVSAAKLRIRPVRPRRADRRGGERHGRRGARRGASRDLRGSVSARGGRLVRAVATPLATLPGSSRTKRGGATGTRRGRGNSKEGRGVSASS